MIVDQAHGLHEKASTVVGPTNFQPSFFRSLERAVAAGEVVTLCGFSSCFGSGS
jgi:hypothetical protein